VRRFFDGLNHESDTGDEALVLGTFTTDCTLCASEVVSIHDELQSGQTIKGAHLHLLRILSAEPSARTIVSVSVTETEDGGQLLDARGKVIRSFQAVPPTKRVFQVNFESAAARIFQIDRVG